ncbi:formate dehydrogenase subunit gamma [Cognatazoarcus halotolerans]|uniref:formate dehydrogenase subunit gamma n=1 Tax=Cognatazoarcus halotolerans TaxID=2686016 RepID=UPI00135C0017|nr:formate dehydrogenase subunit gamma [Cognatazoarcus halotolerans]MCB1899392.1 formate dehydrogenase subunit gamma [Rhodocyclaceae bacterium]MCP5310354.1 formate dehydrogenase subunit gamma [Zoogloeaceae bacterium]
MKRQLVSCLRHGAAALVATLAIAALPAGAADAPPPANVAAEAIGAGLVQPGNNANAFREARRGEDQSITFAAPPDRVLIQSQGETWRQMRNGPITQYGGWAIVVMFLGLVVFYAVRGEIKLTDKRTGKLMERFKFIERLAHWSLAGTFVILGLTGIAMLFGKHLLLPLIGHTAFGYLAWAAKNVHNFIGPLFLVSVLLMVVLFVRDNVWQAIDALWIRKAGGLLSGEHVPSHRFNFGEKTWFWLGVVFLGLMVGTTGLILDFPLYGQTRQDMQLAHMLHSGGAMLFIALSLAHIYIGTVGMEGALEGMKTGYVDETWAREHHEYWYREARGERIPDNAPRPGHKASAAH